MASTVTHAALRLLVISLGAYAAFVGYMYLNQKSYIYFPDEQDFDACPGFAASEKIRAGGTRMYYTNAPSNTVVVYYHGNAGSACNRAFIKDRLTKAGYASLFVEYAGYSGDDRAPARDLVLQDAKQTDHFLRTLPHDRVILMGASLGAALAAYHQTLTTPDRLVLFTPFDTLSNVGKMHYPFLPIKTLLREEYDAADWLKEYDGAVLIIHGADDEIIPIKRAQALYDGIPSAEKRFLTVAGETHNTLLDHAEAWAAAMDFINQ